MQGKEKLMKRLSFSDPMFLAFLAGRKKQTRRIMNPQPEPWVDSIGYTFFTPSEKISLRGTTSEYGPAEYFVKPPFSMYEVVAISAALVPGKNGNIRYRANNERASRAEWRWKTKVLPARFCPVSCCTYRTQILRVSVQRVQEISEGEAQREGWFFQNVPDGITYDPVTSDYARVWYRDLWNSLHTRPGERFEDNPWVWVYDLYPFPPRLSD
jgi:hypothetical protein